MRIAIAQINNQIGDFELQKKKVLETLQFSKNEGADLVLFSELAIGGYPAKDLWMSHTFIQQCEELLYEIAKHCNEIACIIGLPTLNNNEVGKPLYNSFAFIVDGKVRHIGHKCLLPDYDVFDEYRYFEPHDEVSLLDWKGFKFAVTICEDLWNYGSRNLYKYVDPLAQIKNSEVDFVVNLAASPYSKGHFTERVRVFENQFSALKAPLFYINQIGAYADLIFDGHSMVFNKEGKILDVLPGFQESTQFYDLDDLTKNEVRAIHESHIFNPDLDSLKSLHEALIFGIQDYFKKMNFKSAVLGLSGGLDSAVVAALACEALGAENVYTILMPSQYSSDHSLKDALDLVENTGCHHTIIPIQDLTEQFDLSLQDSFLGKTADVTEENIQARIRGILLMAHSNKFGHILLNTSNKSESAVGYGTLYGDMNGSLSVIGDVFKTDVFKLARYINREREIIPLNTIVKPPSAELRPDQKDSDSLPNYDFLDLVLKLMIEEGLDREQMLAQGYDPEQVLRIYKLVEGAEFKRKQSPPVLRVSKKAFGSGWSYPLVKNSTRN